jgi:serine/threonine protein kinase
MLCGYLPFDEELKATLYQKILNVQYTVPKFVSEKAQDLVKRILVRNPKQRFTI